MGAGLVCISNSTYCPSLIYAYERYDQLHFYCYSNGLLLESAMIYSYADVFSPFHPSPFDHTSTTNTFQPLEKPMSPFPPHVGRLIRALCVGPDLQSAYCLRKTTIITSKGQIPHY